MTTPRAFIVIIVLLTICCAACRQQSSVLATSTGSAPSSATTAAAAASSAQNPAAPASGQAIGQKSNAAATPELDDVETIQGPFQIGGHDYTVSSHYRRIKGTTDPSSQTLALLEIVDASRQVYFHQSFTPTVENGEFSDACSASTEVFSGNMTKYLWITLNCDSCDSISGGPWQLFGAVNGKLVPFGKPIVLEGDFVRFVPGAVSKIGAATMFQADSLEFRVSAGNFFVTIPMRVNLVQGSLDLGIHCFRQTGHGMGESGCDVPVQVERTPVSDDITFVRLFSEPAENSGTPAHVVIRKDSKVEFLAANVRPTLTADGDFTVLGVTGELWLKVRIDGKEGWIHTQEDFDAIGLPFSG